MDANAWAVWVPGKVRRDGFEVRMPTGSAALYLGDIRSANKALDGFFSRFEGPSLPPKSLRALFVRFQRSISSFAEILGTQYFSPNISNDANTVAYRAQLLSNRAASMLSAGDLRSGDQVLIEDEEATSRAAAVFRKDLDLPPPHEVAGVSLLGFWTMLI